MTVPVLTAVTGASWESSLVAELERAPAGIHVVRRCVDLADLLAAATSGTARAVLLSAELRRLDRDALARLASARVAVVGLVNPGDEAAEERLRQLGVRHVLPADTPPADIAAVVAGALDDPALTEDSFDFSQPLRELADLPPAPPETAVVEPPGEPGRLVAVWGPTGAPGRTTVATGVAVALATQGVSTLLADADVYGGVVAQTLGLLDEAPGLAAAARLANNGVLDLVSLARVAPVALPGLRVLSGISRADRWPELRPAALEQVWEVGRRLAAVTVVDCGFCLEQDEELAYDTAAPRRNGATLATLAAADRILAVGAADPIGLQRLVRGLSELRELLPGVRPQVVLNRVRRGPVGRDPERALAAALERYAGVLDPLLLPDDRDAADQALLQGRSVLEVAPESPLGRGLRAVAASVAGVGEARAGRRLIGRR